jgi:peptidyl-prolyl cis-trans isomerase D
MISWIQHHLIRHGRWIFLTLLTVIIVAFVFTIGNTPGCTTDRTRYEENLFYGIDLNSPLQRDAYIEKASLSAFLNGQQQMRGGEVETRIAMLHLADEVGVPAPDEATLAEYVRSKNAFLGPDGEFSADAYTRFLDQLETNPRSKQNLVSVLEEDYRIDQVAKALSGPGYLLPSEASAQAQQSRTTFTLVTAGLAYANFEPELEPDEATLKAYYDANKQGYEIPERVQASYVLFESKRFGDNAVEVSEAELRDHFAANRAAFVTEYKAANPTPKPAEGEEAPAPEVVSFEKVRDAVAKSLADEQASDAAHRAAQAFIEKLYLKQITLDSATFNQLLNDSELSLIEIEPYTQSGARQRALSPAMLESAFTLVGNRYYSDAYELDDGYGILILQDRIAPVIPPFEDVAAEVASDYKPDEKRRLFNEKGESLKAELEAALAEDKAFAETAESRGLKVNSFESFEGNDAPADLNRSALRQAQTLDAGEISPMLTLEGVGTFVYVQSKDVPELDEEDPDLAQTKSMLERWASFTTRSDLTNELIMRGLPEGAAEETSE